MVHKRCLFLLSAMLLGCALDVHAQDKPASSLPGQLAEVCQKHDLPGMVVALVDRDGLVESAGWGVRKRGTADQIEVTDRFALGSCTKSMTATLAAVLVEAGKIDWTTTLGEVWPKASDEHIHPRLQNITLDELLSHQSGLPSDLSGAAWASFLREKKSPVLERRRMVRLILPKSPAHPQRQYAYANLGYVVAAAMLETRAEESFESLMRKHVFEPLEMESADFRTLKSAAQMQPPFVWGHRQDAPVDPRTLGAENPTAYAGCGTVHLNIEDYAKYARWHLAGKPQPVLQTQAAFDHLHQPLAEEAGPGMKYACGWICASTSLGPGLNHGGSNTNSFALIWVVPDANFAAVVCTNSGDSQAFPACDEVMGRLMQQHEGDPGLVTPDRLVGRYQLNPNFVFDVRHEDGQLMVGITNQATQEVFADSPTRWSYRSVDATLEFHLRSQGPAYALTLHQNGRAQKATRVAN